MTKDLNIVTFAMFAPIKAHALIGASSVVIVASRNDAIKRQFLGRLAPRARSAEFRHEISPRLSRPRFRLRAHCFARVEPSLTPGVVLTIRRAAAACSL